jgi:hypothetical protein
MHFAEIDEPAAVRATNEPVSVSSVLSSILSRIFGTTEGAVFAHEEKKEDADDESNNEPTPGKE